LTHGVKYFKGEEPVPSGYSFNSEGSGGMGGNSGSSTYYNPPVSDSNL
jgi:hypothetical protein